jgi:hypothetical protein
MSRSAAVVLRPANSGNLPHQIDCSTADGRYPRNRVASAHPAQAAAALLPFITDRKRRVTS